MKRAKFYVVWVGVTPGIYTSWRDCQLQVKGYEGALYKVFDTRAQAEQALQASPYDFIKQASPLSHLVTEQPTTLLPPDVAENSIAVDAACSGNPGMMEYQGVYVATRQQIFHFGPLFGTNNVGEFLAIVHALALLKQKGLELPIYSDSANAIGWVGQKRCKTKLLRTPKTEPLFQLIERAEKWLQENSYTTPVLKWNTRQWGEIPADFGRK